LKISIEQYYAYIVSTIEREREREREWWTGVKEEFFLTKTQVYGRNIAVERVAK
jgi:hypothetical protein